MATFFRGMLLLAISVNTAHAELRYPAVFEAEDAAILSAERPGVLKDLSVKEGQWIKSRQILAKVGHEDLTRDLKATRYKLAYLQSQLANSKQLGTMGMAPTDEVNKTRMERDIAVTNIELLEVQIARSVIRAPFGGMVQEILVRRHEWVTAGKPVLRVINPTRLRVVSSVPTAIAVKLKVGASYRVLAPDVGNKMVTAKLVAKTPMVDVQSNTVKVIWRVTSKRGRILPGMKAWMLIP